MFFLEEDSLEGLFRLDNQSQIAHNRKHKSINIIDLCHLGIATL